jgi:hypothetical protein
VNPGTIVSIRNRNWVLLPQEDPNIYLLRLLTGAMDEVVAIHKGLADLIGYTLPMERLTSATFPLPSVDDLSDVTSVHLLWQSAFPKSITAIRLSIMPTLRTSICSRSTIFKSTWRHKAKLKKMVV